MVRNNLIRTDLFMKKNVIVIAGATASGKSSAALDICTSLDGELISCDSMQIYRKMNIGTAKPTEAEMTAVRHHLIDVREPWEDFSSSDYVSLAKPAIDDVLHRGKLPVVCGGTGLYLDSLMFIRPDEACSVDEKLRGELLARDKHENWLMLSQIDPESAEKIHENNIKRVVRALEIYYLTGKTKSEIDKTQLVKDETYNYMIFVLSYRNREILYDRINRRVDIMLEEGLEREIRELLQSGELKEGTTAYQAIGYKELIGYINGQMTLDEAVESLKQATRNYAKRQITWFSRYKDAEFVYADDFSSKNEVSEYIVNRIREKGKERG